MSTAARFQHRDPTSPDVVDGGSTFLRRISPDAFSVVVQWCDAPELLRLSQTCRRLHRHLESSRVWSLLLSRDLRGVLAVAAARKSESRSRNFDPDDVAAAIRRYEDQPTVVHPTAPSEVTHLPIHRQHFFGCPADVLAARESAEYTPGIDPTLINLLLARQQQRALVRDHGVDHWRALQIALDVVSYPPLPRPRPGTSNTHTTSVPNVVEENQDPSDVPASVMAAAKPIGVPQVYKEVMRTFHPDAAGPTAQILDTVVEGGILDHPSWFKRREAAAACTLSDGYTVFAMGGFANDPFLWFVTPGLWHHRAYLPYSMCRTNLSPLMECERVVYGHSVDCAGRAYRDMLIVYGGCTEGGYRGVTSELRLLNPPPEAIGQPRRRTNRFSPPGPHSAGQVTIELGHPQFPARAYHAHAVDERRGWLLFFGGLEEEGVRSNALLVLSLDKLRAVLDKGMQLNNEYEAVVPESGESGPTVPSREARARQLVEQQHDFRRNAWINCVVGCVGLPAITPRFGHTMAFAPNGNFYISGGYTGSGMFQLYDGEDLADVHALRLHVEKQKSGDRNQRGDTGLSLSSSAAVDDADEDEEDGGSSGKDFVVQVRRVGLPATGPGSPTGPRRGVLGRCHSATMFGPYLVYFGGHTTFSNRLVWLDTRDEAAGLIDLAPLEADGSPVTSRSPVVLPRVSHCAVLSAGRLFVFGGCFDHQSITNGFSVDLVPLISGGPRRAPLQLAAGSTRAGDEEDDEDEPASRQAPSAVLTLQALLNHFVNHPPPAGHAAQEGIDDD